MKNYYPVVLSGKHTNGAIIAGASTSSTMPLANLLTISPTEVCRFSSLSGMYFTVNLGAARNVAYVWLGGTNATSAATIRWRFATTEEYLTRDPLIDSGYISHWPSGAYAGAYPTNVHHYNRLANPIAATWLRADLLDAANPAGYYEAARLLVGCTADSLGIPSLWRPERGAMRSGVTLLPAVESPIVTLTEAGGTIIRSRPRFGSLSLPCAQVSRSNAGEFERFVRAVGLSGDVAVILNPADTANLPSLAVRGRFSETPSVTQSGVANTWNISMKVEEFSGL